MTIIIKDNSVCFKSIKIIIRSFQLGAVFYITSIYKWIG